MAERKWPIPFLDVSNTLFFFFVSLFAMALLVIGDTEAKKKIDTTSKLLVHLTWADNSNNDIDLSLKTPNDHVVWFRRRQADFASLDHDNLGITNGTITDTAGNVITSPARDEVIYIRQTLAGTYVVNVQFYAQYNDKTEPVEVTLVSIEPHYKIIATRQFLLTEKHEEHTAFRFTMDQDGNITSTDGVEELFVNQLLGADQ